jgi:DNA repair protein RadA/Sms
VETLSPTPSGRSSARGDARAQASAVPLRDLGTSEPDRRATGIAELDRVLGGGIVPGAVVLLGGEPGIGKSTLDLEAAAGVALAATAAGGRVLYASGEESAGQLRLRARRLGAAEGPAADGILVLAERDIERIVDQARDVRPALLVVDSIQTVALEAMEGPAGSVGQVREAAARLVELAKSEDLPVVLVGHVTKDGSLAGPKTLEHLVDVVLTLEGERYGGLRLLRAVKNRFGSTEEIGVFEMAGSGLREVPDPARAFLGQRDPTAAGTAVAATLEGSRPILVEVQALVAPASGFGPPRRTVSGIDSSRLALLLAVLARRAGVRLGDRDVYASLAGGLSVAEPALDLPLALALASSARDVPVPAGIVAVGEVGLLGELRPAPGMARRLREAARLGFERAIVPPTSTAPGDREAGGTGAPEGIATIPAATLGEALRAALGDEESRSS